jgi:sarcosine oxidase gamma subunit
MASVLGGSGRLVRDPESANMAPARAAAYLGGTLLLVAWLASAAGVSRRQQGIQVAGPRAEALQLDALATDVQSQAVRLRTRLAAAPAPQMPLRNPFMFAASPATVHRVAAPAEPSLESPVPEVPEVLLELAGVAEQNTDAGVKRTAMVAAPGDQFYMVTEGQELAGRYRVSAVGADAVELKDLVTGATRRLALK